MELADNLETPDGRKIVNVATNEMSIGIESTEQKARGDQAAAEAEMARIKLNHMKRGIRVSKLR